MYLTASVGTVSCWDYEHESNRRQKRNKDDTPSRNDGFLSLPTGVDAKRYVKSDRRADAGFFNYVTGTGTGGLSGSFTLDGTTNRQVLLFKAGRGQNSPTWFAFQIVDASPATVYSWNIRRNRGGAPNGLSHITAYVPIPTAAWLLGSGLVALFGISRRRRAAA
jgi:hypothetical protein